MFSTQSSFKYELNLKEHSTVNKISDIGTLSIWNITQKSKYIINQCFINHGERGELIMF